MENSIEAPQKAKNRTAIWSYKSTFRYIAKGNKISMLKSYLYSHVHCSIIHHSQDMESTCIHQQMIKISHTQTHTHTHTHTHNTPFKKKKILSFLTTWMNQEDITLNEISHLHKEKHCMMSPIYGTVGWMVVARSYSGGEMRRCPLKGTNFQLNRMNKFQRSIIQHRDCNQL
jgi:hypothetical protein